MRYAKPRLSLLMFIQFFVSGATLPILSLYLKDHLGFTGAQVGLVMGLSAVGSIISPVLMTFIAGRIISSERLLGLLHLSGGLCMVVFSMQTEFYSVLFLYIVYNLITVPCHSLITAITFHHMPSEGSKFGNIRVWGTIGWISVAWIFSFIVVQSDTSVHNISQLPLLLVISAAASFIMSVYSLTIPASLTHELKNQKRAFFPVDSFKIMLNPQVLTLSLIVTAVNFVDRFYSVGTAPYLKQIGFSEESIMPAMSLGQIPEIFAMGILAYVLKRWGMKKVLIAGMCLEMFRFGACALGQNSLLVFSSLSMHGLAYTFIFITALISLDSFCNKNERTGVHQLFSVLNGGVGGFLGSFTAGKVADYFSDSAGTVYYDAYWMVPFLLSGFILGLLVIFIEDVKKPVPMGEENAEIIMQNAEIKEVT
ncbi:MAG: MFS transporter [Chitinispirillales bacterium]|jgi:nucleoside transporter|nr:MFS transporter [Chitinispirillales bacterium]